MSAADPGTASSHELTLRRIGLVVHPSRDIDEPYDALTSWAGGADVDVVQVTIAGRQREVAPPAGAEDCDLVVAIGGDGTTLAALHAAAPSARPVLGVACGSLGALTSIDSDAVAGALERVRAGEWEPRPLPALRLERTGEDALTAFNDVVVVRAGEGQVRTTARVDGTLFCRFAGDGCIVTTPVGSSAYTLAAGGPLLMTSLHGFALTPLPSHGGSCPPVVINGDSELRLEIVAGWGGVRLELDGQIAAGSIDEGLITLRPDMAIVVAFADQEPLLSGLRQRRIITDSPRILADDERRQ